ncbi:integrase [Clostridium botulinum]|uniref:tyrosine-type recombinase/integrase n=1 Tax=Clostridium botulinum TaxID=1491 RepID=UPI000774BC24|nr:tyrosine-type recombinase/integrase [Clostridium botulinum]NFH81709.1 integrase [Clostridium botulinum]NFH84946.1 integrase [Clostridium botulinum]NFI12948.1 integrase [Clostridium botulinum]NFI16117.1 integrase [Clostridium botulinum]NFO85949.1 integrase [Clostridium botulinum]
MEEVKKHNWEKGTAAPIPENKYEQFKEELIEYSKKYEDRNLMLFVLARATGYRMGDLVSLTIGQIKDAIEEGFFLIQESKQYKQWLSNLQEYPNRKKPNKRKVYIKNNLERYLRGYVKGKKRSEYAFPSNKSKNGIEPIEPKSYSAILTDVGKKVGLKHISGHSPRKTYATRIYERSGRDLEKVRIALNHQSIEETKRYLGIKEKMQEDAAEIADEDI